MFVGFKITQIEKSCLPPIRADVLQSVLIRKTQSGVGSATICQLTADQKKSRVGLRLDVVAPIT